jgi:hypothetical protein
MTPSESAEPAAFFLLGYNVILNFGVFLELEEP